MLLVGVDDTDSRSGGCTTSLADGVASRFPELTPEGPPRLVRLNPNVPWKTRGNGAIALLFDGSFDLDEALRRVVAYVEARARREEGTSPGVVVAHRAPDPALYDATVSRIVERAEVDAVLARIGARSWGGRGVIGAAAALAWPGARSTWELISYREDARVGAPRDVSDASLRAVEEGFPSIFDTFDLGEDEAVCVPASPCPVLFGLRGVEPRALVEAATLVGPEPAARRTLFLTNQATDDHLRDRAVADCRAFESARVQARVAARPQERGGHVFVEVKDDTGRLRCAAYAPTRAFRALALALRPGDELLACGGLHEGPDGRLTLGIEKMRLDSTAPRKLANPRCCGRAMQSAGARAGWRCRACGARSSTALVDAAPPFALGWHEVPSCARRHLARPLKLLASPSSDPLRAASAPPV